MGIDNGDGHTTLWMYFMSLNCIFVYNKYILPHFEKMVTFLKKMTYIYSLQENLIALMFVSIFQIKILRVEPSNKNNMSHW